MIFALRRSLLAFGLALAALGPLRAQPSSAAPVAPHEAAPPSAAARQLCADIRRALFRSGSSLGAPINATLRYAGRTIDRREPGSTEVGVTVRLEATFSYSLG